MAAPDEAGGYRLTAAFAETALYAARAAGRVTVVVTGVPGGNYLVSGRASFGLVVPPDVI